MKYENLDDHIRAAINDRIKQVIAEEIAEAKNRIQKKLEAMTDGIALSVLKNYSIVDDHNLVTIKVIKK